MLNEIGSAWSNIASVERETGLGKDTLRVWERRYGFPTPERDAHGVRLYSPEQVIRLRLIKRLMDRGLRPGKLLALEESALLALATEFAQADVSGADAAAESGGGTPQGFEAVFTCLRQHDAPGLRRALSQLLAREGLLGFVMDIVPQLNLYIGVGWERGEIQVFEEHLYTEQMQVLLRQAIASLPPGGGRPRVLLTTVPEEQHVLGILMLEALLTLQGAHCVSLGTQTPLSDIAAAASAHRVDVVALSFSEAFPARQVMPLVEQLRAQLPAAAMLWLGGGGLGKGLERQLEKLYGEPVGTQGDEVSVYSGVTVGRTLSAVRALADASMT